MNQQNNNASYIAWRFYLTLGVIAVIVLGLMFRLFYLTVLSQPFLKHEGDERVLRMVSTKSFRGMILDRNGFPLAVSTTVYSVWINPQEFAPNKNALQDLTHLLKMKNKEITTNWLHAKKKKREFIYLKRALSPELANQIKTLHIPGVYIQEEYRRYYPEGEVMAHVIGFTNVDDQGQEGLELQYNQWLQGEPGKKWVIKDRLGRIISDVQKVQDQKSGHDLTLSIDRRIQYLAYRELMRGIIENRAESGSAVVLDAKTGEILAMVNQPSFNPNNRAGVKTEAFRNRVVTDTFEPGSTMKAFTVASALELGRVKPDTVIDTAPGWMRVGRNIVRDEHNNGVISVSRILQVSSNIGAAKIVLSLPPNQLWSLLSRVGFGEATGIGFPGEQNGTLIKHDPWGSFTLATLAFGYGLSVTTLQLAHAYSVLANSGEKKPLSLLKIDTAPAGEKVMNPKVAKEMLVLLEAVFQKEGTGAVAKVPGYHVTGKTGTARKVGIGGYQKHSYTASLVGIAPMTDPRLVVAVVIHDPRGKQFLGGYVSGPVFERIMEGTLRILDVPPDDKTVETHT